MDETEMSPIAQAVKEGWDKAFEIQGMHINAMCGEWQDIEKVWPSDKSDVEIKCKSEVLNGTKCQFYRTKEDGFMFIRPGSTQNTFVSLYGITHWRYV